jgi:hypothetical protein
MLYRRPQSDAASVRARSFMSGFADSFWVSKARGRLRSPL